MTELLAVISGVLIAVMISMNGQLSSVYGNIHAAVLVHLIGLLSVSVILLFKRSGKKLQKKSLPWYMWLGGVVGFFTTVSNITTLPVLGVTLTLGFGLLGQCLVSLLVDGFGWLGVKRHSFSKTKLAGLAVICAGVVIMLLF